ncbi:LPXTG cell wall anchor domain-containing protein, partial [Streptococcus pyogenes]
GLDVRKDEHKKALEAVAKRVTAEIEADPTLTPEVREQQKAEVQKELELATDKIAEAKDADEADKAYGDGVTAIENAHVIGKGIEARKDLAKKDLAEAVAKTKALIIEDKTLTDDQRKEQLSGVDTEYAKGIENIAAAKDAAGVDKAYSDGVRDILAQYKEGQNLDDRRNAAKEFLLKEADKVTKLINDDPTLTHDQKVDQINKVEQAKLDAIKSVDDAQTADDINDALGKGIENINNQYQHGDGVDVRKATAKGDLEKEAAKVREAIANDPTLTKADKAKQTEAVAKALKAAIAAVDKATTAEGINQELGKGITAINKAYRPGEGVKARKEAAKADLEKEAAKVREAIANDPTLTKADKAKQTEAVAKALKAAIAAVDKATTADGVNQELGKGITAINKAYRPGEGVKARKEAAKANLEKVAKETKALISGDRYLSETEKAVQKQAVEQALAKALGQVEAAKTVEAVKLAENLGTVAIRSAYVAGLAKDTDQATAALNEAKQAAIEALKQAAAETLAKITTDAKLTEAQKAEQSENVSLALKTAIATVRSAQSIASVKEAKDKGITAIRAAYVPNKAVAKSSSANHLPKSGDANSIVLVGLGVMSLLLGMVLYSKKKESKD